MAKNTINPEKLSAPVIAIFDLMSDGEWHNNKTIIAHGAQVAMMTEPEIALTNGYRIRARSIEAGKTYTDAELLDAGARDIVRNRMMIAVRSGRLRRTKTQHKMTAAALRQWKAVRPENTPTQAHAPIITLDVHPAPALGQVVPATVPATVTVTSPVAAEAEPIITLDTPAARRNTNTFGGLPEAEGWAEAPLILKSRIHFRIENDTLPLREFRADMPSGTDVTYDEGTGLYRVDVLHGTANEVRNLIVDWCATHGYDTKGLRVQDEIRRRDINALNPGYLSDLCEFYARYCRGPLRKHKSTLQFHFKEADDETQQIFEWVLEGVACYNDESGVPFGAYLVQKLPGWVHNLNRAKYGRNLSDAEMKQQRAIQDFTTEHGRKPTEKELAAALGQEISTFRKTAGVVSNLQSIRNAGTLDVSPFGDSEVPLPDDEMVEDRYEDALQQSLLSQVMTRACDVDEDARGKLSKNPNILGWVANYEAAWLGKNKVTMAAEMNTSTRNMSQYSERAKERMRSMAGDLMNG